MTNTNIDQELSEIFDGAPIGVEQEIELPSRGVFYSPKVERIRIRPLVFEDQKALVSARKNKLNILDMVLEKSIINPPPGFISNLVTIDKIFLVIKIREISISNSYKASIVCPGCQEQYEVDISINEIPINYYDQNVSDPIEIDLPGIKKKVKAKVVRNKDSDNFLSDESIISNLWRNIVELAGKSDHVIISSALNKLPLVDIRAIVDAITLEGYGIDPKFEYCCSDERCQYKGILTIPLTEDFFTMKL